MKEKFLPIGTVVLLKGGKKEVMITSYCIFPTGEIIEKGTQTNGKGKMFDYGACLYPEGIINSDQVLGFNHDKIEKICYMGYETDVHKEFSDFVKSRCEEIKASIEQTAESQA